MEVRKFPDQKSILSIYDVSGIQEYIFATSRLSENAGASEIVGRVLKERLPKVLEAVAKAMGGRTAANWRNAEDFQIPQDADLLAEIVYIGGGSAIVAYRNLDFYDKVNEAFAKDLLETSYTLSLATAYVDTDFFHYKKDRERLEEDLEAVKARMLRQRPMGALPIVAQEALTSLPVTQRYGSPDQAPCQNLSTLQALKRQAYEAIRHNAESLYGGSLPPDVSLAVEMEDLISQKGVDGFVAVVHIDGNGMGELVRNASRESMGYQDSVRQMRKLSQSIEAVYHETFDGVVKLVEQWVKKTKKEASPFFSPTLRGGTWTLPIRPIILDGDDVTFICNGRLGVPLAALFLRCLAKKANKEVPLSACAGVALVNSHFPFNMAYEIAEACCQNAKKKRLEEKAGGDGEDCGYFDFHIMRGAYMREIENLREGAVGDGGKMSRLMMRPYRVAVSPDRGHSRSFDSLDNILSKLPAADENPKEETWPRSRLKKLYEAYLMGREQVEITWEKFASRGYTLSSLTGQPSVEGVNAQDEAFLYDALELMDIYERNIFSSLCDSKTEEGTK